MILLQHQFEKNNVNMGKYGNNKNHNHENIDDYDYDDDDYDDDVDENDNNNSDDKMEDFINDRFSSLLKHILSIKAN